MYFYNTTVVYEWCIKSRWEVILDSDNSSADWRDNVQILK